MMLNFSVAIDHQSAVTSPEKAESRLAVIARASFVIYIFYIFFGTQMPFREAITDVEDIATSNIANQIIFSLLFLTSAVTLIPKRGAVFTLIKKEKFLALFLIWCLCSVFWSDFSFVSFKRLFQVLVTVCVSLAVLLYTNAREEPLQYFKWISAGYILASIVSVALIPEAMDPAFMTWRGLAATKNHLGQAALISAIIWFGALHYGTAKGRMIAFAMIILSLTLLLGAKSLTSITTLVIVAMIWLVFAVDDRLQSLGIGRLFMLLTACMILGIASLMLFLAPEIILDAIIYFGKDATFTGRTDLWGDIFAKVKQHLLIGCGFSGFWVMDNVDLMILYQDYVWLPLQAHNGYLDILNETGMVGLALFAIMLILYFRRLFTHKNVFFWKWLCIAVLIINFQETTLFRPNILTGVMFIFAYLALYSEIIMHERSLI